MFAFQVFFLLAACAAEPRFVTSDPNGGWPHEGYYVHNNMWNSAKYNPCTSRLSAWSHSNWHVLARMNNEKGDGAVKVYPNVHRNYRNVPIASFESITSTFAGTGPKAGIYNFAYDLWINGIARPGCTEIMIWTENYKQVPGGKHVEDALFGGRAFKVYKRSGSEYIAFVASENFTSGTLDLLEIVKWVVDKGWLSGNSTLHQVCYGVEIVSTDDAEAKFEVTAFSIDERFKAERTHPGNSASTEK